MLALDALCLVIWHHGWQLTPCYFAIIRRLFYSQTEGNKYFTVNQCLSLMEEPMFKFVTLYRRVDDEIALENFFSQKNLPLAEKLPGLNKSEVSRVLGKPGGESRFHLMYELYFETAEVFYEALKSESGQELMRELKPWAEAKLVTWFYCDSFEEFTQDRIEELDATD